MHEAASCCSVASRLSTRMRAAAGVPMEPWAVAEHRREPCRDIWTCCSQAPVAHDGMRCTTMDMTWQPTGQRPNGEGVCASSSELSAAPRNVVEWPPRVAPGADPCRLACASTSTSCIQFGIPPTSSRGTTPHSHLNTHKRRMSSLRIR